MRSTEVAAPPHATFAAEVRDLSFSYEDRVALDGLSLSVPQGSVFGLLGPNGSGKSTLLSLLAGLRAPAGGELRVLGETPSPALRARIGFLFQETSLDPLMTVREVLWLHGRLFGLPAPVLRRRIEETLATVGLADRARSSVHTLSGGMKRRLELARALLPWPELLLLDEPTTGLDPDSEQALWSELERINREGATVVLATNKVAEAERHCGTVAFIHEGRVVAQGPPAELKAGLKRDAVWLEGLFTQDLVDAVGAWPDVGRLTWAPPILHATVDSASTFVPRLFQAAGDAVISVRLREATLEDAYFDIVGTPIANGGEA
ncbi:MAG: ABC transporter ATP-binding protein [Dehalococcoidia bacterium]|nr:ABC transporter ATP-binding protein [Dehalococcoidia bacterium]